MPEKKPKKAYEQKIVENYFPVSKDDLKYTTEKIVKEKSDYEPLSIIEKKEGRVFDKPKMVVEKSYTKPSRHSLETVEKKGKSSAKVNAKSRKRSFKKGTSKKKFSKEVSKKDYVPPNISLKKNGYELIITEKPQAASKIASALGKPSYQNINKVPYYEVERDGIKIFVACAVGHLFTLKQKNSGFPAFDISWVPNYIALKKDFTKKYYDVILKLSRNAGSITVATDFDIEGEVIGLNVIRFICNQKDANRMKFSTLTNEELNKAYESKSNHLEWGQAIAGETRHYLDWFYGINLSRALMNSMKSVGKFKILSIGRVQGPALNLIVQKEREIQKFKPEKYWQVFITAKNSSELELKYNKDIFDKKELVSFENILGKKGIAETIKSEQKIPPNPPFNLTTLQVEAYKLYGITPSRTLQIAQSLYLSGLISYPRTSSQKLPESIDYHSIRKKLAKEYNVEKLMKNEKPVEGKKTDSAHPSIYPTGEKQVLSGADEKIYNLIVRRFLSLFCEDAIVDNKKVIVRVDELLFSRRGSSIRRKAWMEIYPVKLNEEEIPDLSGEVNVIDSRTEEKETNPPRRYSPASIISELEKRNLGTKATRSNILETLYDRNYIKEKSIEATAFGMSLISTLEKFSPIIIDEKLTRDFEGEMEAIQNAKKGFQEKEDKVIEKAKETIVKISKDFEKNQEKIGKELVGAQEEIIAREKIENILMQCPKCKKGNLAITYSPKTKRNFVACNSYPECKTTYSLPPNGVIKKTNKACETCGFPILMRLSKGRRPWEFCFNPECSKNRERIEAYKKAESE